MNLLTFLGTADYEKTTYVLGEHRHATCYCPVATAHFFRPETTLVVVTEGSQAKHFEPMADELSPASHPVAVMIPDGHSEADLWTIFDALTQHVDQGDELIVDITNGFRSLPFLSFLAVAFLRIARKVRVQGIYYGAWEARDRDNDETPIFDLTPFVTLLDWTIATDRFVRFGDARDLAEQLRVDMPPGPQMQDDSDARQLGKALKHAADAMEDVSLSLRLTRPLESMKAAHRLADTMEQQRAIIEQKSRPFSLLADRILEAYQPFGLAEPLAQPGLPRNLTIQLQMMDWYLEKGQVVQAVALAREWLVSLMVYRLQAGSLIAKGAREPVEKALNNAAERLRPSQRHPLATPYDEALQSLDEDMVLARVWDQLTTLRNDLAHVGMRRNAGSAKAMMNRAKDLYPILEALARTLLEDAAQT